MGNGFFGSCMAKAITVCRLRASCLLSASRIHTMGRICMVKNGCAFMLLQPAGFHGVGSLCGRQKIPAYMVKFRAGLQNQYAGQTFLEQPVSSFIELYLTDRL